jgi:hypothetical protein
LLFILEIQGFETIESRHTQRSNGVSFVDAGRYQVSIYSSRLLLGVHVDGYKGKKECQK